jgi:hypothetical protein
LTARCLHTRLDRTSPRGRAPGRLLCPAFIRRPPPCRCRPDISCLARGQSHAGTCTIRSHQLTAACCRLLQRRGWIAPLRLCRSDDLAALTRGRIESTHRSATFIVTHFNITASHATLPPHMGVDSKACSHSANDASPTEGLHAGTSDTSIRVGNGSGNPTTLISYSIYLHSIHTGTGFTEYRRQGLSALKQTTVFHRAILLLA